MQPRRVVSVALSFSLLLFVRGTCWAQGWVDEGWAAWETELTARQQPEKVMDLIGLKPGMRVAEIGAQVGRFTVHLARRVGPEGRVFANDISPPARRAFTPGWTRRSGRACAGPGLRGKM